MKRANSISGKVRLYVPVVLAFFVFCSVIGAEYLIVDSMIKQSYKKEIERRHGEIDRIIDSINGYEKETKNSIINAPAWVLETINAMSTTNSIVQIKQNATDYAAFLQAKYAQGSLVVLSDYEDMIIETSVGKTQRGTIVILESYEYLDADIKNMENLADSLIVILIAMMTITLIPGLLLIESLARRSSMISSLAPDSAISIDDVLLAGLNNSSGIPFMAISPAGDVIFASPSCIDLLEIGKFSRGLFFASLTVLPAELREKDPLSFTNTPGKCITINSMNGTRKECSIEIHPFYKEGKIASILFLFIPSAIDEYSQVYEQEKAGKLLNHVSSRAKTHLLKSLIHDMNNHISGIIGIASNKLKAAYPDEVSSSFSSVLNSSEQLASLCKDLQTTVTGGANRRLRDLLQEMYLIAEVLRKTLPERVEIEVTGDCCALIKADRELLREFFYGFALNSTAVMNGEGRIRIDVSRRIPISANAVEVISPGDKVCIRYSDGFIMPVALRDILSNRNYSVSDVERQYGATIGNGYRALNQLAGSVVFERGSGETILCLLLDGYESIDDIDQSSRSSEVRNISVLVADDMDIVLRSVSEFLERSGMLVTRAEDGDKAMKLLQGNRYDAAVLDLSMPGIPTAEIVRYCQTNTPDMAVVISTGFDVSQEVKDLIIAPSTNYLHKPHKPEVLLNMIYTLINKLKEER